MRSLSWRFILAALAATCAAHPLAAQLPDSACVAGVVANADTLARLHLPGAELYPTQRRSRERLVDFARARCVTPKPDTVVAAPHDSIPAPHDSIGAPTDTIPAPPDSIVAPDTTPAPPAPPSSGVAELPRTVPRFPAARLTAPCTQAVSAAGLPAAIAQATDGDVLCLAAGAVYRGTLTLPARGDSGWVVIRTAPTAGQPASGERVRPSQRASLATIEAQGTASAIVTAPSAHGWVLTLLEVTTDSALSTLTYALIDLQTPPTAAQFASDIVLDRVWAHGWAHRPLRRCVALNSAATTIANSWLDDCHEKGSDSQAIAGWSGPGPYLITYNYLAGAGENVMFGGADPKFRGVHPSDVTITRNHIVTPSAWRGVWTKKNILEAKNVARMRLDSNVFDGSWGDGQTGYAVVLKSTNQGGTAAHRDQSTRDVTMRRNLIVRAGAAFNLNGKGGNVNTDSLTRRVVVEENYADSLCELTCDTRGVMLLSGATDILMRRNTWLARPGTVNSYTGGSVGTITARNLVIDGDLVTRGKYLLSGCWTSVCTPGLSFRAALIGSGSVPALFTGQYPDLSAALSAGFGISRATIDAAVRGVVQQP